MFRVTCPQSLSIGSQGASRYWGGQELECQSNRSMQPREQALPYHGPLCGGLQCRPLGFQVRIGECHQYAERIMEGGRCGCQAHDLELAAYLTTILTYEPDYFYQVQEIT